MRRQDVGDICQCGGNVVSLDSPHVVVGRKLLNNATSSRFNRWPATEPLPAIAMVGTDSGEVIARKSRETHVADLGVNQAVQQLAAGHAAAADSRPHRDINEVGETTRGAPAMLAQSGAV